MGLPSALTMKIAEMRPAKTSSVKRVHMWMKRLRSTSAATSMYTPTQMPTHALSVRKGTSSDTLSS